MRMRFKPYARPELAAWPCFIDQPKAQKGNWSSIFAKPEKPLRLELGCGKGGFIASLALAQPSFNHIGVDLKSEVLVVAKRTIEKSFAAQNRPVDNVVITAQNIEAIEQLFAPPDSVDRIYINFCNPWYKSGHTKHRLTHPRQLIQYRQFLRDEGQIYFKTDDTPLFEDSLRYFELAGFAVEWLTRDLHANEPEWNIRTEHEAMFSQQEISIKGCIVTKKAVSLNKSDFLRMRNV